MQYCEDWCVKYRGETLFISRTFDGTPCIFKMQRDQTYLSFRDLPSVGDPVQSHSDLRTVLILAVKHPEVDFEVDGEGYKILETPKAGPDVFQRKDGKVKYWWRVWGEGYVVDPPMRPGQVLVFAYRKQ